MPPNGSALGASSSQRQVPKRRATGPRHGAKELLRRRVCLFKMIDPRGHAIGLSAQNLDVLLMKCKIISPLRSLLARTTIIYIVFRLRKRASSRDVDRVVAVRGDRAVVGGDQRGYSMIKPKHRRIFDAVARTASSLKRDRRFADSPLEGDGFELVWGFSCQVVVFGFCRFFVRSWKAVLRPVACDQVRGARGRGQGTETVAKLGGLPPSVACVSQRLDA
jgi:hypothetical protein